MAHAMRPYVPGPAGKRYAEGDGFPVFERGENLITGGKKINRRKAALSFPRERKLPFPQCVTFVDALGQPVSIPGGGDGNEPPKGKGQKCSTCAWQSISPPDCGRPCHQDTNQDYADHCSCNENNAFCRLPDIYISAAAGEEIQQGSQDGFFLFLPVSHRFISFSENVMRVTGLEEFPGVRKRNRILSFNIYHSMDSTPSLFLESFFSHHEKEDKNQETSFDPCPHQLLRHCEARINGNTETPQP